MNHLRAQWKMAQQDDLYFYEVDVSDVSQTRCVMVVGKLGGHYMPIGYLTWDRGDKMVAMIYVDKRHRRQGVGTKLWEAAKKVEPGIHLRSSERSPGGTAWSKTVVDHPLPKNRQALTDRHADAIGARMMAYFFGLMADGELAGKATML